MTDLPSLDNPWLILVLALLSAEFALETGVALLNRGRFNARLPDEFVGFYDAATFEKSIAYQRDNSSFATIQRTVSFICLMAFLLLGGFGWADDFARGAGFGGTVTGLIFAGILLALKMAQSIPFSLWQTFRIEERFGFNRTTPATFALDLVKGVVLGTLLGAPVFAGVCWFFDTAGGHAWWQAWLAITAFQLAILFVAPVVIMPLFNKFVPLEDGELKREIERYARDQSFPLQGVFTMDGSKRSSKSNAFFTGFGKIRKLALFDTLIAQQTVPELVAVVAHEIGHFKRKHIPKSIALSLASTGVLLFAIGRGMRDPDLIAAFGVESVSTYASVVLVAILAGPFFRFLSFATNGLSRKFEFEADDWAVRTYGNPETLVSALKKLSRENLSQLSPHRLKVLLDYSHPPVMDRIAAIRRIAL